MSIIPVFISIEGEKVSFDQEVWIVAIDSDSFNHTPKKVDATCAHDNDYPFYVQKENCQHACDHLNSL